MNPLVDREWDNAISLHPDADDLSFDGLGSGVG